MNSTVRLCALIYTWSRCHGLHVTQRIRDLLGARSNGASRTVHTAAVRVRNLQWRAARTSPAFSISRFALHNHSFGRMELRVLHRAQRDWFVALVPGCELMSALYSSDLRCDWFDCGPCRRNTLQLCVHLRVGGHLPGLRVRHHHGGQSCMHW